jgi:hypothetical protein
VANAQSRVGSLNKDVSRTGLVSQSPGLVPGRHRGVRVPYLHRRAQHPQHGHRASRSVTTGRRTIRTGTGRGRARGNRRTADRAHGNVAMGPLYFRKPPSLGGLSAGQPVSISTGWLAGRVRKDTLRRGYANHVTWASLRQRRFSSCIFLFHLFADLPRPCGYLP